MYVKFVSHEQVNYKRHLSIEAKAFLILVQNTVLLHLCDTFHQIVINVIERERELSQNGLTLHQHTERK